jgi:hypothetical protein
MVRASRLAPNAWKSGCPEFWEIFATVPLKLYGRIDSGP